MGKWAFDINRHICPLSHSLSNEAKEILVRQGASLLRHLAVYCTAYHPSASQFIPPGHHSLGDTAPLTAFLRNMLSHFRADGNRDEDDGRMSLHVCHTSTRLEAIPNIIADHFVLWRGNLGVWESLLQQKSDASMCKTLSCTPMGRTIHYIAVAQPLQWIATKAVLRSAPAGEGFA